MDTFDVDIARKAQFVLLRLSQGQSFNDNTYLNKFLDAFSDGVLRQEKAIVCGFFDALLSVEETTEISLPVCCFAVRLLGTQAAADVQASPMNAFLARRQLEHLDAVKCALVDCGLQIVQNASAQPVEACLERLQMLGVPETSLRELLSDSSAALVRTQAGRFLTAYLSKLSASAANGSSAAVVARQAIGERARHSSTSARCVASLFCVLFNANAFDLVPEGEPSLELIAKADENCRKTLFKLFLRMQQRLRCREQAVLLNDDVLTTLLPTFADNLLPKFIAAVIESSSDSTDLFQSPLIWRARAVQLLSSLLDTDTSSGLLHAVTELAPLLRAEELLECTRRLLAKADSTRVRTLDQLVKCLLVEQTGERSSFASQSECSQLLDSVVHFTRSEIFSPSTQLREKLAAIMLVKSTLALECTSSSRDGDAEEKARRLTYELLDANRVVIDVRSCAVEIVRECPSAFAQDAHNVRTLLAKCLDDGDLAAVTIQAYGQLLLTCWTSANKGDLAEFLNDECVSRIEQLVESDDASVSGAATETLSKLWVTLITTARCPCDGAAVRFGTFLTRGLDAAVKDTNDGDDGDRIALTVVACVRDVLVGDGSTLVWLAKATNDFALFERLFDVTPDGAAVDAFAVLLRDVLGDGTDGVDARGAARDALESLRTRWFNREEPIEVTADDVGRRRQIELVGDMYDILQPSSEPAIALDCY